MQHYQSNQMPYGTGHQTAPGATGVDPSTHQQTIHDVCKRYHHYLVQFETSNGQVHEGIIDSVDQDGVNMLVPIGDDDREIQDERQFGYGGYSSYGGYGGYHPHSFGHRIPRRFRRFRRFRFPFFGLRRFFFPFFY